MWVYSDTDCYPRIILHDCHVSTITVQNHTLSLSFDDGFWITPNHRENPYAKTLRTGTSQITYTEVEIEDSTVYLFKKSRISGRAIRSEILLDHLRRQVNGGEWSLELVDEFYSAGGAFFRGEIHLPQKLCHMECQMSLRYKGATYHWNEIRENRAW